MKVTVGERVIVGDRVGVGEKVWVTVLVGVIVNVRVQVLPGKPQGVLVAVGGMGVAVGSGEVGLLEPQATFRMIAHNRADRKYQ